MSARALAALAGRALCVLAAFAATNAAAQAVQRCETPDGKVTYANTPQCPPGTEAVRSIERDTGPSAAEQKAARERAQQRSRELDKLERQRQKLEDKASRERAAADARQSKREAECTKLEAKAKALRDERDAATLAKRQSLDRKVRSAEDQVAACRKTLG